jgi:hypothetical protein
MFTGTGSRINRGGEPHYTTVRSAWSLGRFQKGSSVIMSAGKSGGRGRDAVILLVLVILGVAGIAGFGFYQDEVKSFFRLQAWDLSPAVNATRQFLAAAAKGDGNRVAAMVAPGSQTLKVLKQNGKVTGITIPDYGEPRNVLLKTLAPSTEPKIGAPRMVALDGGVVIVEASFPRSHSLKFTWDHAAQGWVVKDIGWTATPK